MTPGLGIRQAIFERDKYIIWEAGEVIYRAGDPSNEAFLIMEGSVQIFTSKGLLLKRISTNEILGETSLLLNVSRQPYRHRDRSLDRRQGNAHSNAIFRRYRRVRPGHRRVDPQELVPSDRQQHAVQHAWDRN